MVANPSPPTPPQSSLPKTLSLAFAPVHKVALGLSVGLTWGAIVALVTAFHVITQPEPALELSLLSHYYYGYSVSWPGAGAGLFWGFINGFVVGWFVAFVRNFTMATWLLSSVPRPHSRSRSWITFDMLTNHADREDLHPSEQRALQRELLRMNEQGWGLAIGSLCGIGLFLATLVLVVRGGEHVGAHLNLLSVYFPGYRVTFFGCFVGFVYAFVVGYAVGRTIGTVYNRVLDATS